MQQVIKSFSELNKLTKRDFYAGGKLKPLDNKFAISVARQISTGFEKVDLRKPITNYQYRKARKIINMFFEANTSKSRLVRPSKANRELYAQSSALPKTFKIFPMAINSEDDKFEIKKRKGKKKLIRRGKFIIDEDYYFPDRELAALEPEAEAEKLLEEIKRDYEGTITQVHVKVGPHATKNVYTNSTVKKVISEWTQKYGNFTDFVMGLKVYSFDGQQAQKPPKKKIKKTRKNGKNNKGIRNTRL